jgi:hypothetical protein
MNTDSGDRWKPLESLLGLERCVGFMFMGRLTNGISQYKHGISRRYLFLDDDGATYERIQDGGFCRIETADAIAGVEEPLRETDETLETPYDCEYIRRNGEALRAISFEVLRVHIRPEV